MRRSLFTVLFSLYLILVLFPRTAVNGTRPADPGQAFVKSNLRIGWASTDITPDKPVILAGQFHARISEGIMDPVTATVLVIESAGNSGSSEKVVMISCDLVKIADEFRDRLRELVVHDIPELRREHIILNATHTHTAPYCAANTSLKEIYGVDLKAMPPSECLEYISQRIRGAVVNAWESRRQGGVSYGLGQAVISHNRLVVNNSGNSVMYGNAASPEFSHIEGYEDHSVNLIYTWDAKKNLTGVVINVPSPSQVSEQSYMISADFWNEVRNEVAGKLGKGVHILPQCSAAGDQSPHILIGRKAEERMQHITGMDSDGKGLRVQIAARITEAVISILPYMKENIEMETVFMHHSENAELSRRLMSDADLDKALKEARTWEPRFNSLLNEFNQNPALKEEPRWYKDLTIAYSRMRRGTVVKERHDMEKSNPELQVELHVIRIGEMVIATNPFELYLDYGMRIKGRSPAVQTFIVQLAGNGTYLPPQRSVEGGSYGAEAASTLIGPEGGNELVEKTLNIINMLWKESQ
jgi:hypothetical protein